MKIPMGTKQDIEKWRKKLDFRITDSKSEYHRHHIIEEFAYKYDLTIPQAATILESKDTGEEQMKYKLKSAEEILQNWKIDKGYGDNHCYWSDEEILQMMREVNQTPEIAEFYELTCLDEDGYIGSNGYYTSMESAEKAKKEIDGYKMNIKYGIKQNIITHSFS